MQYTPTTRKICQHVLLASMAIVGAMDAHAGCKITDVKCMSKAVKKTSDTVVNKTKDTADTAVKATKDTAGDAAHAVTAGANTAGAAVVHGGQAAGGLVDKEWGNAAHEGEKAGNFIHKELKEAERKAMLAAMKEMEQKMRPMTSGIAQSALGFKTSANGKATIERLTASIKARKINVAQLETDMKQLVDGLGMAAGGANAGRLPHLASATTFGIGINVQAAQPVGPFDITVPGAPMIIVPPVSVGATAMINLVWDTQRGVGVEMCGGGTVGVGQEVGGEVVFTIAPGTLQDVGGGYLGLMGAGGAMAVAGVLELTWPFADIHKASDFGKFTQAIPTVTMGLGVGEGVEAGIVAGYCHLLWKGKAERV